MWYYIQEHFRRKKNTFYYPLEQVSCKNLIYNSLSKYFPMGRCQYFKSWRRCVHSGLYETEQGVSGATVDQVKDRLSRVFFPVFCNIHNLVSIWWYKRMYFYMWPQSFVLRNFQKQQEQNPRNLHREGTFLEAGMGHSFHPK